MGKWDSGIFPLVSYFSFFLPQYLNSDSCTIDQNQQHMICTEEILLLSHIEDWRPRISAFPSALQSQIHFLMQANKTLRFSKSNSNQDSIRTYAVWDYFVLYLHYWLFFFFNFFWTHWHWLPMETLHWTVWFFLSK